MQALHQAAIDIKGAQYIRKLCAQEESHASVTPDARGQITGLWEWRAWTKVERIDMKK